MRRIFSTWAAHELASRPATEEQAVFETDANMSAHDRAHRHQRRLMAAGADDGELVVLPAKQSIGRAAHQEQIFRIGAETPSAPNTH